MKQYVKDNALLTGAMYAPFCRTKYVDMSEWEADIKKMSELGYTCLHGFSEWWRIEKKKGEFDFTETDKLIELCTKYGITPIINVATQNGVGFYMPRWMQDEYRGRGMVDFDNKGITVRSEYLIACMDDPWYQTYSQRYLKAVAQHYAGDKRIGGWVIWGEPMLSSKEGKPICYCEHTITRFRDWLRSKYETIDALNEVWGTEGPSDYADFTAVNPPVGQSGQRGGYASWMDFQSFMCDNFSDHIKLANRIFKENGATQPTITELFCYVSGSSICNDIWQLAETSDIVGVSNYLRPGMETDIVMTVANSIADRLGKSVFVVEALGGSRYFNYDKRTPCPQEVRSECVQMVGSGAKGLMYWVYRPRLSDFEGGTFGMCRADGKPMPVAIMAGQVAQEMKSVQSKLFNAKRIGQVGILYSSHAVHIAGGDNTSKELQHNELGAMKLLINSHITPQLVNEEMIQNGLPENLKVLILPFAYAMNEATADGIKRFVENGGTVIANYNLAFKRLNGIVYKMLPGGGLEKVFGLEKDGMMLLEHESLLPPNNPYGMQLGSLIELITPTTAKVIESNKDLPMITYNTYGKGKAWYITWSAFADYNDNCNNSTFASKLLSILADSGVTPFAEVNYENSAANYSISLEEMTNEDGSKTLTIINPGYESQEITLYLDAVSAEAILEGCNYQSAKQNGKLMLTLSLAPWQSTMFVWR